MDEQVIAQGDGHLSAKPETRVLLELCICVSVERKVAKSELRDDELVPTEVFVPGLGSAPTDVVETGRFRLVLDTAKYRPVRGGCLIMSGSGVPPGPRGSAGTLGGLAYDARTLEPAFITNRHCLFRASFFATQALPVFQPGGNIDQQIGVASDAAPMRFGQSFDATMPGYNDHPLNAVDAAKANFHSPYWTTPDIQFDVIDVGKAIYSLGAPSDKQPVQKHGAASGLTKGRIVQLNFTEPNLCYDEYPGQTPTGQPCRSFYASVGPGLLIQSDDGNPFALPGDSGSVVFSQESGTWSAPQALGLVFSATVGGPYASACDIQQAFSALDLVTVCRGIYLQGVRQARLRAEILFGRVPHHILRDQMNRFDELRDYARRASEPGRALVDLATAAIPQFADALHRDPVAFGVYVRLVEKFGLQPTVLDMLEVRIDDEAIDLLHRLLGRVERVEPASGEAGNQLARAVADVRGQRIADLLRVELG